MNPLVKTLGLIVGGWLATVLVANAQVRSGPLDPGGEIGSNVHHHTIGGDEVGTLPAFGTTKFAHATLGDAKSSGQDKVTVRTKTPKTGGGWLYEDKDFTMSFPEGATGATKATQWSGMLDADPDLNASSHNNKLTVDGENGTSVVGFKYKDKTKQKVKARILEDTQVLDTSSTQPNGSALPFAGFAWTASFVFESGPETAGFVEVQGVNLPVQSYWTPYDTAAAAHAALLLSGKWASLSGDTLSVPGYGLLGEASWDSDSVDVAVAIETD